MTTAYVNLWNKRVGAVLWDAERKLASFEYEPDFLKYGLDVAPLMMPLEKDKIYSFPDLAGTNTFKGLP